MTRLAALTLLCCSACATVQLSASDLDRVRRPAFVARIALEAGPHSTVFRDEPALRAKLQGLELAEADRRLAKKLAAASNRFETSERLRVGVTRRLPQEMPWTRTVPAAQVAGALESFLVEEVPARSPDFRLLEPLGVDAVVELVVEDYGMKSRNGITGVYLRGHGRMFRLGGGDLWRRSFDLDTLGQGEDLDPLRVARDPTRYRQALAQLLDRAAEEIARDLQPAGRKPAVLPAEAGDLEDAPDDTNRTGKPPPLPPGELPPPDEDELPAPEQPQPSSGA